MVLRMYWAFGHRCVWETAVSLTGGDLRLENSHLLVFEEQKMMRRRSHESVQLVRPHPPIVCLGPAHRRPRCDVRDPRARPHRSNNLIEQVSCALTSITSRRSPT